MAHHKSTLKSIKTFKVQNERNSAYKSAVKTEIKKLEANIESKDKDAANKSLVTVQSKLMKAVSKKVIKQETAARKLSRLNTKVKAI